MKNHNKLYKNYKENIQDFYLRIYFQIIKMNYKEFKLPDLDNNKNEILYFF